MNTQRSTHMVKIIRLQNEGPLRAPSYVSLRQRVVVHPDGKAILSVFAISQIVKIIYVDC